MIFEVIFRWFILEEVLWRGFRYRFIYILGILLPEVLDLDYVPPVTPASGTEPDYCLQLLLRCLDLDRQF